MRVRELIGLLRELEQGHMYLETGDGTFEMFSAFQVSVPDCAVVMYTDFEEIPSGAWSFSSCTDLANRLERRCFISRFDLERWVVASIDYGRGVPVELELGDVLEDGTCVFLLSEKEAPFSLEEDFDEDSFSEGEYGRVGFEEESSFDEDDFEKGPFYGDDPSGQSNSFDDDVFEEDVLDEYDPDETTPFDDDVFEEDVLDKYDPDETAPFDDAGFAENGRYAPEDGEEPLFEEDRFPEDGALEGEGLDEDGAFDEDVFSEGEPTIRSTMKAADFSEYMGLSSDAPLAVLSSVSGERAYVVSLDVLDDAILLYTELDEEDEAAWKVSSAIDLLDVLDRLGDVGEMPILAYGFDGELTGLEIWGFDDDGACVLVSMENDLMVMPTGFSRKW